VNFLMRAFRSSLANIKSNKQICAASVGSITIALSIMGLFLFIFINLNSLLSAWDQRVQLVVYLNDGISADDRKRLDQLISRKIEVVSFEFISRKQAWAKFESSFSKESDLLEKLDFNPLPASYNLKIRSSTDRLAEIRQLSDILVSQAGVESVEYGEKWIGRFETFMIFMKVFLMALASLISLGAVLIISNTIKLSVFSRKDEIELMLLIGATPGSIKAPYLLEGMFQGLLGALVSISLVKLVQVYLKFQFQGSFETLIRGMEFQFLSQTYIVTIFITSIFIGLMGSYISLQQFLNSYYKK